jgi:hypothetical protein
MDNKPVKNSGALENLKIAIAHLMLAAGHFGLKDQREQEDATDVLIDSARNLWKQVTK